MGTYIYQTPTDRRVEARDLIGYAVQQMCSARTPRKSPAPPM